MNKTQQYPERLCLFGGSFDPIHNGHLILAQYVLNNLDIPRILFMPAYTPPHKPLSEGATFQQRYEMTRLAVGNNNSFLLSDYEIRRKGVSYTIDTINHLLEECEVKDLYLLIGEDSLEEFMTWKKYDKIIDKCTLTVFRRFFRERKTPHINEEQIIRLKNPIIEISSTFIRECLQTGKSIRYIVPPQVEDYIQKNRLYLS